MRSTSGDGRPESKLPLKRYRSGRVNHWQHEKEHEALRANRKAPGVERDLQDRSATGAGCAMKTGIELAVRGAEPRRTSSRAALTLTEQHQHCCP